MTRYLVLHDYGMGGMWWWVWAPSADMIVETIAEVEVVTGQDGLEWARSLDEYRLDSLDDTPLADLRDQRTAHRGDPAYGWHSDRERVYLRQADPDYDGAQFLIELGPDGRRLRQVEVTAEGTGLKSDDWPFNPPIDLRDPTFAAMEISAADFEDAWSSAVPDPDA